MKTIRSTTLSILVALTGVAQTSGTWSTPVAVNTRTAAQSSIALDDSNRAVAVWTETIDLKTVQTTAWTRTRGSNLVWGKPTQLGSLKTYGPVVRATSLGDATAIWTALPGLFAATAPPAGPWTPSQIIGSSYYGFQFAMNSHGDAAVVWNTGGPPSAYSAVQTVRRIAGGPWSAVETVVSSNTTLSAVTLGQAAIGETGDLVVSWESYRWYCPLRGGCHGINFVLQASRQSLGATTWEASPALTAPELNHGSLAAIDGVGRASIIFGRSGTYYGVTQSAQGQPWTAPAAVYTNSSAKPAGFGVSAAGDATLVFLDSALHQVIAIPGTFAQNQWSAPVVVSGGDSSATKAVVSIASSGAAAIAWPGSALDLRASVRPSANAAWSTPKSIGTGLGGLPDSIAVNATGYAALSYSTASRIYTASYTP